MATGGTFLGYETGTRAWLGAAVLIALAGCSSANDPTTFGGKGGAGGSGQGGAAGDGGGFSGAGGGGASFDASGEGNPVKMGCSSDLQKVVDDKGVAIETCAPDKGCSGGVCVPPCQAAADSHGNVGCEFMVATPSFYATIKPPCFAVFLANAWPKEAKIMVARGGQTYDVTQFGRIPSNGTQAASWPPVPANGLPAGQVAVLFLSHDPQSVNATPLTCPVPPAINASGGTAVFSGSQQSTGKGQAWRIVTDVPVSAYDILPFGGAKSYLPSAELILPTSAWGDNYVAVVPRKMQQGGPQWGQILAAKDGTEVKIVPTTMLPGGSGVAAAPMNQVTTYTLGAGEYVQWQDTQDMTGSVIQATDPAKPISFTGGNGYLCYKSLTSTGGGCDSGHQMIPPVKALGSEYVAPPFATRRMDMQPESIPYRIVGAVDGTQLSYDPPVAGAPTSLGSGKFADFESNAAFVVKSQDDKHPFYLGQLMPGCQVTSGSRPGVSQGSLGGCLGDEEYVNILPPAQFLAKYVFFSDPTYPTTNLVFVRVKMPSGFQEVEVECFGNVTGWKPVGAGDKYQVADLDLVRASQGNGKCNNGPQVAKSAGAFGVMVWGEDSFSSYGYPAGGNVAPINTVVVPPIPK